MLRNPGMSVNRSRVMRLKYGTVTEKERGKRSQGDLCVVIHRVGEVAIPDEGVLRGI